MNQFPEMTLEEQLERIERRVERCDKHITELREDWRRDLDIVFEALKVIGQALDIREKLTTLIEKLDEATDDDT
jgi:predicted nucleic acid-binding protein